ncbi:MAG: DUF58 domain-containing protein [Proteobacteria bacterium]|nr:DUF58 domain-containing protein [Pseudomonadota bacterium]MCP4921009.1 DUF58 domain-containing protein [Pseudomonadota bacterium]
MSSFWDRFQERWRKRIRVRPTRDGWWFLLLLLGLTAAAFNTGNNLLYIVLSLLLAMLFVQNVLAEWNLRWVKVERRLPPEVFAYEGALGSLVLKNTRKHLVAVGIEVEEVDAGEARALFGFVPAGESVDATATWTFAERGPNELSRVVLSSTFPFGLFRRTRELDLAAELLVFPRRRHGPLARGRSGTGNEERPDRRSGGAGDFQGLRPYQPGDPVRSIHWPNSSRAGQPLIVLRERACAETVIVKVDPRRGRLEASLALACGQIVRHFAWGHAVGLQLGDRRLEPRQGSAWRRRLLTALALFDE